MAGPQQRYRGFRQRHWGSWVSEIRHPLLKTRIWLGTFETAEDAARAYDEASRIMCGTRARTNFSYDGEPSSVKFLSATLMSKLQNCHIASLRMTKRTALFKQDNPDERITMNMKNDENGANNSYMSRERSDENKSMEDDQVEQMIQELLANGSIDIELLSDHGKMKNVDGKLY